LLHRLPGVRPRRDPKLAPIRQPTAQFEAANASTAKPVAESDMNSLRHGSPFSPPCSRSKLSEWARQAGQVWRPTSTPCGLALSRRKPLATAGGPTRGPARRGAAPMNPVSEPAELATTDAPGVPCRLHAP